MPVSMRQLTAIWLLAGSALVANAGVVLDQENAPPLTGAGGFIRETGIDIAQTFTVGTAGRLSRLEFSIARTADTNVDLTVEVRSTTGGVPDPTNAGILLSTTLSRSLVNVLGPTTAGPFDFSQFAFVGVDIDALGLDVTVGDQFAIALRSESTSGGYGWAFSAPESYSGGHGFFRNNNPGDSAWNRGGADQLFRTYVRELPEPTSWLLAAMALAAMTLSRRSSRPGR